ncbi:unnamed protein product [Menidia menidia]|uniref:(Atlantic silverside) hypothetical protein n=1 Tax=Menidia menidia TaxID=238744 RepID=A0A8S4BQW2_9TELE|nr:unnamed protein product [Menidia menidia]
MQIDLMLGTLVVFRKILGAVRYVSYMVQAASLDLVWAVDLIQTLPETFENCKAGSCFYMIFGSTLWRLQSYFKFQSRLLRKGHRGRVLYFVGTEGHAEKGTVQDRSVRYTVFSQLYLTVQKGFSSSFYFSVTSAAFTRYANAKVVCLQQPIMTGLATLECSGFKGTGQRSSEKDYLPHTSCPQRERERDRAGRLRPCGYVALERGSSPPCGALLCRAEGGVAAERR